MLDSEHHEGNTILEAHNLRFRYSNESPLVLDIDNLSLSRGSAYSLFGRNMSGKTTLVKLLSGLVDSKDSPIHVRFNDVDYSLPEQRRALMAAGLRVCHQNDPMFPELSIWENVLLGDPGLKLVRSHLKDYRKQVSQVLSLLSEKGASPQSSDSLGTLSGGGRAVIRLLRSVLWSYNLLLLDEPLTNVDPKNRELLFSVLRQHTPENATVLLISHDEQDHESFRKCFPKNYYSTLFLRQGKLIDQDGDR